MKLIMAEEGFIISRYGEQESVFVPGKLFTDEYSLTYPVQRLKIALHRRDIYIYIYIYIFN